MEAQGIFTAVLALVFVLGLIGLLALLARRLGLGFPIRATQLGRDRRLDIVEVSPLDGKRRLVLIRRDHIEHLILISPNSELVIETGILTNQVFQSKDEKFSETIKADTFAKNLTSREI